MLELLLIPSYETFFMLESIENFQIVKKSADSRDFKTFQKIVFCAKTLDNDGI